MNQLMLHRFLDCVHLKTTDKDLRIFALLSNKLKQVMKVHPVEFAINICQTLEDMNKILSDLIQNDYTTVEAVIKDYNRQINQ